MSKPDINDVKYLGITMDKGLTWGDNTLKTLKRKQTKTRANKLEWTYP